jgi:hypothetical protein
MPFIISRNENATIMRVDDVAGGIYQALPLGQELRGGGDRRNQRLAEGSP